MSGGMSGADHRGKERKMDVKLNLKYKDLMRGGRKRGVNFHRRRWITDCGEKVASHDIRGNKGIDKSAGTEIKQTDPIQRASDRVRHKRLDTRKRSAKKNHDSGGREEGRLHPAAGRSVT